MFRHLFILLLLISSHSSYSQSVLSDGEWYKFAVAEEGMYKISFNDLVKAGINPSSINPENIRIYGNQGGMLPQNNAAERPFDLLENAISVTGEGDGRFDTGDYIIFYAHGPDHYFYDKTSDLFVYEKNKYDRKNYYFLTISNSPGLRVNDQANLGNNHEQINSYTDFYFTEEEHTNFLHSGREWWGRLTNNRKTINVPVANLAPEGLTSVYVDVLGQSTAPAEFQVSLNGIVLGTLNPGTINNYNDPDYQYTVRGKEVNDTYTITNSSLDGNNLQFELLFQSNGGSISRGYYNKILIQSERQLTFTGENNILHIPKALDVGLASFSIKNASENLWVWDLNDSYIPKNQLFKYENREILFGTIGGTVKKFALFDPLSLPSPEFIGQVPNQDLKSTSTPDLLIISHRNFLVEAQQLADFRSSFNGYDVALTTVDKIYNEFSSGRQDITAIRDYIKYMYDKTPGKLKYVLLYGRGSYDYLQHDYQKNPEDNTNFIPLYQSRNSLHPVATFSSDDYYGFLEEDEGIWEEHINEDHTLDVAIGRLPVKTTEEAKIVTDKLINYSANPEGLGSWRSKMLFVADDGDNNAYHRQAEELYNFADRQLDYFQYKKLYLGNFEQEKTATGEISKSARDALQESIEDGVFLVNYTGHGGVYQWTDESIFTKDMAKNLDNKYKLPLFVTATCDFGRHDDPFYISGGESLLLNPTGGGIGLVTTSRPVYANSNFQLNEAFFEALQLYIPSGGKLGDIFRATKNNSQYGVNNRNFILLGDPSLRLAVPDYKVEITSNPDTLKAYQEVTYSGKIISSGGTKAADFNGIIKISIIDKPIQLRTKEDGENAPFTYEERNNVIFRGTASVQGGEFSVRFVVPHDIHHKYGEGKAYFYAREYNTTRDASAANVITVGGTYEGQLQDNNPPVISMYLGDSTFRSGDIIGPNTILLAKISDESGINISGNTFDGDITATLDDRSFILNDHYISNIDDYTSGNLAYPLNDLSPGKHSLTLSASDVYNNKTSVTIEFNVTDGNSLIIADIKNYPNPVTENTTFFVTHNRAGDPMEGELTIYNNKGDNILQVDFNTSAGQVHHKIMDWNGRAANQSKIDEGIYYYRIKLRSKLDGASTERFQKLIIIN